MQNTKQDVVELKCPLCRQNIQEHAKKCHHCDCYLDWRRYVNLGNTSVALLIGLIGITSLAYKTATEALFEPTSDIRLNLLDVAVSPVVEDGEDTNVILSYHAHNYGSISGVITGLSPTKTIALPKCKPALSNTLEANKSGDFRCVMPIVWAEKGMMKELVDLACNMFVHINDPTQGSIKIPVSGDFEACKILKSKPEIFAIEND